MVLCCQLMLCIRLPHHTPSYRDTFHPPTPCNTHVYHLVVLHPFQTQDVHGIYSLYCMSFKLLPQPVISGLHKQKVKIAVSVSLLHHGRAHTNTVSKSFTGEIIKQSHIKSPYKHIYYCPLSSSPVLEFLFLQTQFAIQEFPINITSHIWSPSSSSSTVDLRSSKQ